MNDYGPSNHRGYSFNLAVIDIFSKFDWKIPLKNKYDKTITHSFSQITKHRKVNPNLYKQTIVRNTLIRFSTNPWN